MLLVIDIGNTNTVVGIFENEKLLFDFRLGTVQGKTSDELRVNLNEFLHLNNLKKEDIEDVILASVVPNLIYSWQSAVKKFFGKKPLVVGEGTKTGMEIKCENPKEVGADRIVNAVAAYEKYKGPLIVVDLGTATTFDVINEKGQYLGGPIAPGIKISAEALFLRTAKLPKIELHTPKRAIEKNTPESMNSGIVYGYIGLIDGIIKKVIEELEEKGEDIVKLNIVSTGGYSYLLAKSSEYINIVDRDITLEGLRIIYDRTVKK
ncbi:MAG: type III pantothenate kinase [Tissierellia bacterium]|nr:type III pantothenate kinase [Tissierellia bacterium]